jgi:hypothetical protein
LPASNAKVNRKEVDKRFQHKEQKFSLLNFNNGHFSSEIEICTDNDRKEKEEKIPQPFFRGNENIFSTFSVN